MRRIQQKRPVEKTIWEPVPLPMARFIALEQMARAVRRKRRFRVTLGRKGLRTNESGFRQPSGEALGAGADSLALD